jgi:serine/threonine protein kinase
MSCSENDKSRDDRTGKPPANGTLAPHNADKSGLPKTASPSGDSVPNTDLEATIIYSGSDTKPLVIDGFTIEYSAAAASRKPKSDNQTIVSSRLPGFKLLEELGRGAYGVVFKAQDEMLQRQVAIKIPLFRDAKLRDSYIAEARKAVNLEHSSIVPIYHVGTSEDNQPFVVQKLIDGPTLRKILAENKGLPVLQSVRLIREVALAADAAHTAGVVHRDLKPENLLIDGKGHPWVADFGLALGEEDQTKHRGEVAGTPCYMSPEQLRGRADWLDGRSDIWSIGVMMYEMLVGKLPFEGHDFETLKEQICEREPRPIHQRVSEVPAELDQIFQKCCAKKVTDRFASGRDLANALDDFLATTDLTEDFSPSKFKSLYTAIGDARSTRVPLTRSGPRLDTTAVRSQKTTMRKTIEMTSRAALPTALLFCGISILGAAWLFWQVRSSHQVKIEDQKNVPSPSDPTISSTNSGPESASTSTATDSLNNSGTNTVPEAVPTEVAPYVASETPPTLVRPFRVAIDGSGTHTSLQAAIDDASADETIIVTSGTMKESVTIAKNIVLKGEGKSKTNLTSVDSPCLIVNKNVNVSVEDMMFSSQGEETNTIEIHGGTLRLHNCELFAASFDCLKLMSNSIANISNCTFDTTVHPAIQSEAGSDLTINSCTFRFPSSTSTKLAGIQTVESKCDISGCSFEGRCQAAIHVSQSEDRIVSISNCRFKDCLAGVFTSRSRNVSISNSDDTSASFVSCQNPVLIFQSNAKLNGLNIQSSGGQTGIGIQVLDDSNVDAKDISVQGYDIGIGILKSTVGISDSNISQCSHGIFSDSSKLTVTKAHISDVKEAAIIGTGIDNTFESEDISLSKCTIGLYAMAGDFTLNNATFSQMDTSVIIGSNDRAIEEMRQFSLYSLKGLKYMLQVDPNSSPTVKSNGLVFDSISSAIRFVGPGKTRIAKITPQPGVNITLLDIVKYPRKLSHTGRSLAELDVIDTGETQ